MKIRHLTATDIPAAQRLREQAGWNQADDDWRRLLAWSPDGCWAAEQGGEVVGTTVVVPYARRIAWIGMVLVDEAHRRQGIGRALLTHAIDYLEQNGVQTIALDSTPEGQPLYASLGFADAFDLARWRGPIPPSSQRGNQRANQRPLVVNRDRSQRVHPVDSPAGSADVPSASSSQPPSSPQHIDASSPATLDAASIRPLALTDLPAVAVYDARLFGTDRAHILEALHAGRPARCFLAERAGQIVGYVLSRPGARAWHLGPLAADDPRTAERLSRLALLPDGGNMVMDVVLPNADAVALATALGLAQVRRFIRMTRGAPPPSVDLGRLYTSAGPELG